MAKWRRAEPLGVSAALALGFVVLGLVVVSVITVALVVGVRWEVNPIVGVLGIYGFMTVWTGFAWRLYRTGLYVSDDAVRVVYPWRNRVFAWSDVAAITIRPAMLGTWVTPGDAICLKLATGEEIVTPVQRGTAGFRRGAGLNIGPVLGSADFHATLLFLREMRSWAERRDREVGTWPS